MPIMSSSQQFNQLLIPICRFVPIIAFSLIAQPILISSTSAFPPWQVATSKKDTFPEADQNRGNFVEYHRTPLNKHLLWWRIVHRDLLRQYGRNVAVGLVDITGMDFKRTTQDFSKPFKANVNGQEKQLLLVIAVNEPRGAHSEEKILLDKLALKGISPKRLLGGASDREPCEECASMLDIPMEWSIPRKVTQGKALKLEVKIKSNEEEATRELLRILDLDNPDKLAKVDLLANPLKIPGLEGYVIQRIEQHDQLKQKAALSSKPILNAPLFAKQRISGGAASPIIDESGSLSESLSGSKGSGVAKSTPGGIDFSTLELRYIAEDSSPFADRGLRYAFNGTPAASNKNLNAGRIAAAQASDAFFVWLSLSPDKFWVNLNPNEPDRIIDPQFGKTDAGRILLQSDFQMKKTVAKLIHPDTSLGKQYWQPVMKQVQQQIVRSGSQTCPPILRIWIVPSPATISKDNNGIYIADAPLNVKLESTNFNFKSQNLLGAYSSLLASCTTPDKSTKTFYESLYRKLILPRIVQAVNTAPEYAELRRVYRSRVAAEWYRQRSASNATVYREMVDRGDVSSWPARQNWSSREVFDQYVNSIKKGEFHVVHSHKWQEGNMVYTQKTFYVYGGVDFTKVLFKQLNSLDFQKTQGDLRKVVDNSLKSSVADQNGKIWLGGSTITSRAIWKTFWFYLALGFLALPFIIRWKRSYKRRLL
jgi:hypothetical protein